ncbi:oligosaccharide flippase family protein [Candidatus Pacearchaeota archaeon]|nr:oligosaccharide flippase family protein [Candidatus Pacearchaeota archaeon]
MGKKIFTNIFGGSLLLLVTINIFFVLNYFFHFAMARMLPIEQYGILVTLYSIIYILAVFTESIQLVISRYTTEKNDGEVKNLVKKSSRKSLKIALYLFLVYLIAAFPLSIILKIEYLLVALTGTIIFSSFLVPITRGVLQGKKRFGSLGFNMISESVVKLSSAVLLVMVGWMVYGAIIATLLGTYFSLLLSFISLRDILKKNEIKSHNPGIYAYSAPVFIAIIAVIVFYSIDVIMAKIFFSAEMAGYYAVASMISKVIFFGTQPISKAMFPIASESKDGKNTKKIFKTALLFLGILIIIGLLIVFLFPNLLIKIFSGREIPQITNILILPAIATSIISLTNLNILYKLSQGKIKGCFYLPVFIVIEIILLSLFSYSLMAFSLALVASSLIFLIGSIILHR